MTLMSFNQARRLLDHVRPKGELAAKVVLQYIQQKQETGSALNPEKLTPPKGEVCHCTKCMLFLGGTAKIEPA